MHQCPSFWWAFNSMRAMHTTFIAPSLLIFSRRQCRERFQLKPHGNADSVPYAALGSGQFAAMAILESRFRVGMSLEEGEALMRDAIKAGIENDLGSGGNIDLAIIDAHGSATIRRKVWSAHDVDDSSIVAQRTAAAEFFEQWDDRHRLVLGDLSPSSSSSSPSEREIESEGHHGDDDDNRHDKSPVASESSMGEFKPRGALRLRLDLDRWQITSFREASCADDACLI